MTTRGRKWTERTVRLERATAVEFIGPGDDWTLVLHGKRGGASKLTRQREAGRAQRSTPKGGRS